MPDPVLYLESVAGIAGDMFTAAFLDAGLVDPKDVAAVPGLLGAEGVRIEITTPERSGARATHVGVILPDGRQEGAAPESAPADSHGKGTHPGTDSGGGGHHHHHYHYPALVRQLQESGLGETARSFALRVFRLLAEAEAHAHGVPLEKVTFHEVGAVDSVMDVAMAGVCVETLGPVRVLASPVKLGRGKIQIAHGTYPVPPPASARLTLGMPMDPVPEEITREDVELSTPTGLAILRALEPEFVTGWPGGRLLAQGLGSGTMELEGYPNVFRVALLEGGPPLETEGTTGREAGEPRPDLSRLDEVGLQSGPTHPGPTQSGPSRPAPSQRKRDGSAPAHGFDTPHPSLPFLQDRVVELCCNVDDQTGERTAWIMERALEMGALDGWVTPVLGKKGRPTQMMTLLVEPGEKDRFADFLLRRSSTLGVRFSTWDRLKLVRGTEIRQTDRGPLTYKIGKTTDGDVLKEKPEYDEQKNIWEEDPEFS